MSLEDIWGDGLLWALLRQQVIKGPSDAVSRVPQIATTGEHLFHAQAVYVQGLSRPRTALRLHPHSWPGEHHCAPAVVAAEHWQGPPGRPAVGQAGPLQKLGMRHCLRWAQRCSRICGEVMTYRILLLT